MDYKEGFWYKDYVGNFFKCKKANKKNKVFVADARVVNKFYEIVEEFVTISQFKELEQMSIGEAMTFLPLSEYASYIVKLEKCSGKLYCETKEQEEEIYNNLKTHEFPLIDIVYDSPMVPEKGIAERYGTLKEAIEENKKIEKHFRDSTKDRAYGIDAIEEVSKALISRSDRESFFRESFLTDTISDTFNKTVYAVDSEIKPSDEPKLIVEKNQSISREELGELSLTTTDILCQEVINAIADARRFKSVIELSYVEIEELYSVFNHDVLNKYIKRPDLVVDEIFIKKNIYIRTYGEFQNKAIFLDDTFYDYKLISDSNNYLCLVPTRKKNK